MAKSILTVTMKVTELDVFKNLVGLCLEFYMDMPEEMRVKFDEWQDELEEINNG
jgi:hypothetical protein